MVRPVLLVTVVATLACGCTSPGLDPVTLQHDGDDGPSNQLQLTETKDVDILFVIDNSGSMGNEQANLVANFGAFIEVLEAKDVGANYRIGVTTTDNGNPWCPSGTTTPEGGQLVMSSCRTRLGDFVFNDTIDVQDLACNDVCSLSAAELAIQPTATEVDAELKPRPWLQRIEGTTNLPVGTDPAAAFACFGPQGINGCGFESPLESMYLALARSRADGEASHGFMRDAALLAIVIVTDEVDCSYDKDWTEIFSASGNRVFWSDPSAPTPSSAVCWNAGVECFGDPSAYDSCEPVDLDISGQPSDPEHAVLHPISRYRDRLQDYEDHKRWFNPDSELILALIGGVMPDGSLVYADADAGDPEFQAEFGIGPGCTGPLGEAALPPVRIRALVDEFTPGNLHSICAPDYTGALESIAAAIRSKVTPACYGSCAADGDPSTEVLEPNCTVVMSVPGRDSIVVPECLRDDQGRYAIDPASGGHVLPSDEVDVCFGARVDGGAQTVDSLDDLSAYCRDLGLNLEFELVYRSEVLPDPDRRLTATCDLSSDSNADCPGLG